MRNNMLSLLTGIGAVFFMSFAAMAAEKYMPISAYSKSVGYNEYEISAAVIATLMGRPVNIMLVKSADEDTFFVKYTRPSDGSIWTSKCRFDGTRVIWGTRDGRWRVHPEDGVVSYEVKSGKLVVTERYSDGSAISKEYRKSDFK